MAGLSISRVLKRIAIFCKAYKSSDIFILVIYLVYILVLIMLIIAVVSDIFLSEYIADALKMS